VRLQQLEWLERRPACLPAALPRGASHQQRCRRPGRRRWEALPLCFETSSKSGTGKGELLAYISGLKQLHEAK
jgi:hypothetical protein